MHVFHEGCGTFSEPFHRRGVHRPCWRRLWARAVLLFPHSFIHLPSSSRASSHPGSQILPRLVRANRNRRTSDIDTQQCSHRLPSHISKKPPIHSHGCTSILAFHSVSRETDPPDRSRSLPS